MEVEILRRVNSEDNTLFEYFQNEDFPQKAFIFLLQNLLKMQDN